MAGQRSEMIYAREKDRSDLSLCSVFRIVLSTEEILLEAEEEKRMNDAFRHILDERIRMPEIINRPKRSTYCQVPDFM